MGLLYTVYTTCDSLQVGACFAAGRPRFDCPSTVSNIGSDCSFAKNLALEVKVTGLLVTTVKMIKTLTSTVASATHRPKVAAF